VRCPKLVDHFATHITVTGMANLTQIQASLPPCSVGRPTPPHFSVLTITPAIMLLNSLTIQPRLHHQPHHIVPKHNPPNPPMGLPPALLQFPRAIPLLRPYTPHLFRPTCSISRPARCHRTSCSRPSDTARCCNEALFEVHDFEDVWNR
jgi:hypothetical protein